MNPELQNAQDMINALSEQRNAANNQVVQMAAQLQAVIREKDARIAALEAKVEELTPPPAADPLPKANGHSEDASMTG